MGLIKKESQMPINSIEISDLKTNIQEVIEPNFQDTLGNLRWPIELLAAQKGVDIQIELPSNALLRVDHLKEQILTIARQRHPKIDFTLSCQQKISSAVGNAFSEQSIPGVKNVILVASGKGGVGKSTVASNLAVGLAQTGAQVGLLDADMYGPSMPTMFGVPADVRPSSIPGKTPERPMMVPLQRFGIKLVSMGFLVDSTTPMIWRGPMLASASMQLFKEVFWEELDYLVVDLPPGTGDIQLTIAQQVAVSGAVIVSTPQDVALADVIRAKAMFDKVKIPSLGVIENMSYFVCDNCDKRHEIFTSGGAEQAAKKLGLPFMGAIPLESVVRAGGDIGAPVIVQSPETASAQAMQAIVRETATSLALRAHKLQFDSSEKGPSLKISGGINTAPKPKKTGLPILN